VTPVRQKAICNWCGAPSGRQGITLRKVALADKAGGIEETLLCPACYGEYRSVGRRASFKQWLKAYRQFAVREVAMAVRQLIASLSLRRHWKMIRLNYRFRAKSEKVRA
jgi:hypothetical protein